MYYAQHHDAGPARWGVVCTCREPTQLVVAFAAHHIAMGASEVWLFLDQPQPDLEAILDRIPQVIYQVCDASYWAGRIAKPRPAAVEYRQLVNAFEAYNRTGVDWLAHFDADEFLHSDVPVAHILSAQPEAIEFVVGEPRERAYVLGVVQEGLFDGVFRQPVPMNWGDAPFLFGAARKFLRRGVLGHSHGKSFLRKGHPLVPGIHTPRRPASHRHLTLRGWAAQRMRLLHFDGLTSLHWSGKLLRAAAAGSHGRFRRGTSQDLHRAKQIIRMRKMGANLANAHKMHEILKCIPVDQLERLRDIGLVEDFAIDPTRDIAALGLGITLDLSRAAFDRDLTHQFPEVSGWLAEWEGLIANKRIEVLGP